jgi:hypothetical protein
LMMILDMCKKTHKTQCSAMFGHVVDVGAGKRRGLPATLLYDAIFIVYPHVIYVWYMLNGDQISTCNLY